MFIWNLKLCFFILIEICTSTKIQPTQVLKEYYYIYFRKKDKHSASPEEPSEINDKLLPMKNLQESQQVSKDHSEQCETGASDTEAKLKQTENDSEMSRNQNEQLKEDVSNMKEKLKETEDELKNLSNTKNELENKVKNSEREYQLLKEENMGQQEEKAKEISALRNELSVTEKQNKTFSQELKNIQNEKDNLDRQQEEKATEISALKNKLSETEDKIRTLSQELKNIQFENEKLRIDCYNVSQAGQEPIKAMVVLAGPGEDKSGLCDLLSGTEDNFPANQEKTIGKLVKWRGDGDQFLLIDTPVFEPEEDVAETTKIMMNELKKYTNMYVFVIALNGTNPRIDQNRKKMIRELKKMFGHTFIDKNTVFAITNWHYDQGSIVKREKNGQKEVKVSENLLKELNLTNVNIAFLDASYGEENIEKAKIEEQLHKMKHWLFTIPSYSCTLLKQM